MENEMCMIMTAMAATIKRHTNTDTNKTVEKKEQYTVCTYPVHINLFKPHIHQDLGEG